MPLAEERTFSAAGFERFRAVVFPSSGEATVVLRTAKGVTERRISSPTAVELDLGGASQASLSATRRVHLLRPRLVREPGRRGRRVLLTVADTLRFDHANEELMPEVASYFAGGWRFQRAYSPASWTLPSLAAVFTGQLPSRLRSPDGTLISLPPRAETIASRLRDRGYVTAAVIANYTVNHENGFSKGFDLFDSPAPAPDHVAGEFPDAREISRRALEVASWFPEEDFFLYLQFMEPHEPYRDHRTGDRWNTLPRGEDPGPERLAALRAAYASEVRYLSERLGELLAGLGELDLAVFTSDHGEEFFEHGGFRHGPTLYEEVVRVPLWVRGDGVSSLTVEDPISLVDLGSLVLDGPAALDSLRPVTMETYSFGPPRWSAIVDRRQWTLFARRVIPSSEEHPTARWLEEHHPRISVTDLDDGRSIEPEEDLVGDPLRLFRRHFEGYRRGLFLEFRGRRETELEVSGAGRDGLLWGDADRVEVTETGAGELRIEVRNPRPFAVLFLPADGDVEVSRPGSGSKVTLTAGGGHRVDDGVSVWLDPGRPQAELRESQKTLERLRALGYI
ncbi:MAG: sulfatase [Thermoanaerobaculia bacterium]